MVKSSSKWFLVLVIMVAASVLAFGNGNQDSSDSGIPAFDPDKEYTISMGLYGDLERSYSVILASDEFKSAYPNINIEFQSSDFNGHHTRLSTVIAAGEATNDIEALEIGYVAQFVQSGGLTDLSAEPYNGLEEGKDLVPFAMSQATTMDGELVCLPVDIAPAILFYRSEIWNAAGVTDEQMQNLADWDEYIELGKKVSQLTTADGNPVYAITHASDAGTAPLNGAKGDWVDANGNPLMPRQKFIGTLQMIADIRAAGIDGDLGQWTGPWIESAANGTVASFVSGAWMGGNFKNWMAPEVTDWRVAYLPGKVPCTIGGSFLSIPEQVDNDQKAAAWEVIKFLCVEEFSQLKTFEIYSAFPALTTVYNDDVFETPDPYFGGQQVNLIYKDIAESMPTVLVSENDAAILSVWNSVVMDMLEGTYTPEEAYDEALLQIAATVD